MESLQQNAASIVLAVVLIWLSFKLLPWIRQTTIMRKIPAPPNDGWLMGHLAYLSKDEHHQIMTDWADQLGGIYRLRLGWIHAAIVTDPALVAIVLDKASKVDKNSKNVYAKMNVLNHAGHKNNIFTSPSDEYWHLIRKGIMPAFASNNIRKGFHYVVKANEQLISILKQWGPGKVVDIDNAASRIALDVIGRVGFDKDFGATQNMADQSINRAFELMTAGRDEGLKRYKNPLRQFCTFLPGVKSGEQDFIDFRKIMSDILEDVKARGPVEDSDVSVAAHLLRIRDPKTGEPLSDDRIAAEIGVLFTGGFETTGHTIAWAVFCISQCPEAERKVLEELASMRLLPTQQNPKPRPLEYADLNNMTYTYYAIKESMRLYPVTGDGTNRITSKDIQLGQYLIPKGTMVWVPFSAMFNSIHNWDRPEEFRPERWEEPEAEYSKAALDSFHQTSEKSRPKRFVPFSQGTRDCAGQSLARMSYTATIALLFANFSFKLASEMGGKEGVRKSAGCALLTMAPMKGMMMHCRPRLQLDCD